MPNQGREHRARGPYQRGEGSQSRGVGADLGGGEAGYAVGEEDAAREGDSGASLKKILGVPRGTPPVC